MTAAAGKRTSAAVYLWVFAVLVFLTAATVLVSWVHIPIGPAVLVALLIASAKAALVAAFFMHLRTEGRLIFGILGLTAFFMALLFLFPILDSVETRPHLAAPAVSMPGRSAGH